MKLPGFPLPERRLVTGVAIGVLVGVLGVGVVTAAGPAPAASTAAQAAGPGSAAAAAPLGPLASLDSALGPVHRMKAIRNIIRRNFRVDVTATGANGSRTILYVRGSLGASPGSLIVTLPDNSTQTFTVDDSTVVRADGQAIAYSTLKDGDYALVLGRKGDDGTYTARLIRLIADPAAPGSEAAPATGATP